MICQNYFFFFPKTFNYGSSKKVERIVNNKKSSLLVTRDVHLSSDGMSSACSLYTESDLGPSAQR